jgi:hypothetical protein
MNNPTTIFFSFLTLALLSLASFAQDTSNLPYMDSKLAPEERAADLVHRMTLQEKASQLVNQSRAIPRLNVPAYDWWSEALHGVAVDGTTEFPEPVGLAATFDTPRIHEMATAISMEARIVHAQALRKGTFPIFHGLDFWSPNVNIFRDPRWGRGQETYGEDPFLSARMAVAFVTGLQGDDARYYRAISTPKHFAVHSGPESTRHFTDVDVSKHDELDTYLPAFRAAVVEGHAGSVMCAYNAINGQPACASEFRYSGEEGGAAIAETLSGKNNPAGRLPVTFYKDVHQLPHFENYSMKGRTYRYFEGDPLWQFGYGLSYTTFSYGDLVLPNLVIAGDPLDASVTVTNTGTIAGDEVVQLYLRFPDVPGAPIRALRAFQRVHLEPGAKEKVGFHLSPRDLSMVTLDGDVIIAHGKYTVSIGGAQPGNGVASATGNFEINGQAMLSE